VLKKVTIKANLVIYFFVKYACFKNNIFVPILKYDKIIFFLLAVIFTLQTLPTNQLLKLIDKTDTVTYKIIDDVENDETNNDVYYFEQIEYTFNAPYSVIKSYFTLTQASIIEAALEIETPPPNVVIA
jgi:hypothetical protein